MTLLSSLLLVGGLVLLFVLFALLPATIDYYRRKYPPPSVELQWEIQQYLEEIDD